MTERLALRAEVLDHWRHIIARLYIGHGPDGRYLSNSRATSPFRDVDLAALEPRDRQVQTILGIKATNDTQVLKQPDVLMLLYLLPDEFDEATLQGQLGLLYSPH